MQWHSLHDNDVRECATPSPADESGIADPLPTGTHIEVWWPGDNTGRLDLEIKAPGPLFSPKTNPFHPEMEDVKSREN